MSKKGKKALQDIVDDEVNFFLARQSMEFCECAVNLMVTSMPVASVIEFLEAQVKCLKEYE